MKVKTALFIVGGGLGAFALYRYFQKQLALALNWDYKIKYLLPTGVSNNQITFEGIMDIINPSNFAIMVNSYSLDFSYKGTYIANASSNQSFVVEPDTTFPAPLRLEVQKSALKGAATSLLEEVVKQTPIRFGIQGTANINFGGLTRNIKLDIPDYTYSSDIAAEYNVEKPLQDVKGWLCKNLYICV